ncbi:MAG: N-6 DNA methylase [Candidatus Lokiarchaeota archaeon]|nr:N-6 DNA methylase [Candidatus Lokiarchaeota archaeon]
MVEFKEFLIDKGLLATLMERYGIDQKDKEIYKFFYELIKKLSNYKTEQFRNNTKKESDFFDLDIVASVYEENIPHYIRKRTGEFYTPKSVVNYILNGVGYTTRDNIITRKIIDLSCGSGSFLIKAVKILYEKLCNQIKVKEVSKIPSEQVMNIIKTIKNNISGIDINPIACVLCQINLYFTLFELFKILSKDIKNYSTIMFNIFNKDAIHIEFDSKFDYVVGNPPYLFIRAIPLDMRKEIEKLILETNKGQYDLYQIFIEIGLKLLREGGLLGFVVPDSILALTNRKLLRKFIFNSTEIKELCHLGPVFRDPKVSNLILILQKELNLRKRLNNTISIKKSLNNSSQISYIKQEVIKKHDYKFVINLNQRDIEILNYLNSNFPKLSDLMNDTRFSISLKRGVEIGKDGYVIYCETCQIYQPLPKKKLFCKTCGSPLNEKFIDKIILESIPEGLEEEFQHFLYSINRYSAKYFKNIRLGMEGINYKGEDTFKKRIVIRQLSQENLICASYNENAWTSQSIYNLEIIKTPVLEFNHYYLLGLLNSHLLSYYFLKSFGSYKIFFPRILIEKLKNLPIKVPQSLVEKELSKEIQEKVLKILQIIQKNSLEAKKLANQIEIIVQKLYKIPENDFQYIIKSTTG